MASASKPGVDLKRRRFMYTGSRFFFLATCPLQGLPPITSSDGAGTEVAPGGSGTPVKIAAPRLLRKISVEHRALECSRSFEAVHRALIESVPALKPEIIQMLGRRDEGKIAIARRDWPKLWIFLVRDHGALTAADGQSSKAMQYEIGNPLTAESMTSHVLAAGLYAPLRVILYEDAATRRAIFEYDLPSSLFGQFGDERVAKVGQELDTELESALLAASGA
jgi:hypothetical protein